MGDVDGVLGDAVSTHYLIQTHYLLNLRIENFAPIDSQGFRFLLRPGDEPLLALIDRACRILAGATATNCCAAGAPGGACASTIPG